MKIPAKPPAWHELLQGLDSDRMLALIIASWGPAPDRKYRHWDTIKRVEPPEGFTIKEYWSGLKFARMQLSKIIPSFQGKEGNPFSFSLPDPVLEMLQKVDKRCAGHVDRPGRIANQNVTRRYVMSSIFEAISSSQLEGAATTRKVAKEMIRTGRKPISESEQMIVNNYRAMLFVRSKKDEDMSVLLIEEIHDILTKGIDSEDPRYRQTGDGIGVYEDNKNNLLFRPPHASETPDRLNALITFSNLDEKSLFIPPAVKAIILHFWFAYIHPFSDGNGRTARALFYWYMLKRGYWLTEYISISAILRKAPAKYGKSFLYTETDDNDLTYFILAQLKVFLRALDGLEKYLERKQAEYDSVVHLLKPGTGFNHRQIALLTHALRHAGHRYTVRSHQSSHAVAKQTSRNDLVALVDAGLLTSETVGKTTWFRSRNDIAKRLPGVLA